MGVPPSAAGLVFGVQELGIPRTEVAVVVEEPFVEGSDGLIGSGRQARDTFRSMLRWLEGVGALCPISDVTGVPVAKWGEAFSSLVGLALGVATSATHHWDDSETLGHRLALLTHHVGGSESLVGQIGF
jgi:hypothetical protein